MKTRITELLQIRYPIIQGGMMWVGRAELAAAVSNAGGLGTLTALTQPSPEALLEEVRRCRAMTDAPFAVNLTILPSAAPPPYEDYARAIVDSGVRIVETAGLQPEPITELFKSKGVVIVHKCTSVRHALSAERRGADAISIDGFECAGHPGEDDVPGLILIPAACAKLSIPVVASGGIANGRTMAAALALGADGVNMGTRFMLTREAPVHDSVKAALVAASERDTTLIFRGLRNTARVWRNPVSAAVNELESRPEGATFEALRPWVAGARGRQALEQGTVDDGLIWAGQCLGLIDDVPSCGELIQRMVAGCRFALGRAVALYGESTAFPDRRATGAADLLEID
jgi:nitronate monooxygenase